MRALIIGASGGIGTALAAGFEQRGYDVTRLSRRGDGLDLTDGDSVRATLSGLSGVYERIVIATGALRIAGQGPEKSLRSLQADTMLAQFALNAVGPALVMQHAPQLLPRTRPALIAALSARVGSIGDNALGGWYSYRASKAALNQILRTAAIELARTHRQAACVALHPGTVATRFTADYVAPQDATPPDQAAARMIRVLDGLGPADTGRFLDYAGRTIPW